MHNILWKLNSSQIVVDLGEIGIQNPMRLGWPVKVLLPLLARIYLSCCLTHLELPGLYDDEVLFANAAMGNIDGSFVAWQLQVGGAKLPVMLIPHIRTLKGYPVCSNLCHLQTEL